MRLKKPLAALVAVLISMPFAQASIYSQLEGISAALSSKGLYPTQNEDGSRVLAVPEEEQTRFMLTRNQTYFFTAVCYDDCTDIDLYVYDNNDDVVGLDNEGDDHPVVGFTAEYSGPYYAEVTMHELQPSIAPIKLLHINKLSCAINNTYSAE